MLTVLKKIVLMAILITISTVTLASTSPTPYLDDFENKLLQSPSLVTKQSSLFLKNMKGKFGEKLLIINNSTLLNKINHVYQILIMSEIAQNNYKAAIFWNREFHKFSKLNNLESSLLKSQIFQVYAEWVLNDNTQIALEKLNNIKIERLLNFRDKSINQSLFFYYFFKAIILSKTSEQESTNSFSIAKKYLAESLGKEILFYFYIQEGKHYLNYRQYDLSLDQFLSAFWLATSNQDDYGVAISKYYLSNLYLKKKLYSDSLRYAKASMKYFEDNHYTNSLMKTIFIVAQIYQKKQKYNLALNYYFNLLNYQEQNNSSTSKTKLHIAETYLLNNDIEQAKKYLKEVAPNYLNKNLKLHKELIEAQININNNNFKEAISKLNLILDNITNKDLISIELHTLDLLSKSYEKQSDFYHALIIQKQYNQLMKKQENLRSQKDLHFFLKQEKLYDKSFYFKRIGAAIQRKDDEIIQFKNIIILCFFTLIFLCLIFIFLFLKYRKLSKKNIFLMNESFNCDKYNCFNFNKLKFLYKNKISKNLNKGVIFHAIQINSRGTDSVPEEVKKQIIGIIQLKLKMTVYLYNANTFIVEDYGLIKTTITLKYFEKLDFHLKKFDKILSYSVGSLQFPLISNKNFNLPFQNFMKILLLANKIAYFTNLETKKNSVTFIESINYFPSTSYIDLNSNSGLVRLLEKGFLKINSNQIEHINSKKEILFNFIINN